MRRVLLFLIACDLLLPCLFVLAVGFHAKPFFITYFDMNSETNLPAWYATTKLAFSSAVLFLCAAFLPGNRLVPIGLAVLVACLSVDEATCVHENIGWWLSERVREAHPTAGRWPYLFGLPVLVVFGIAFLVVRRLLPEIMAWRLPILGIALVVVAAISGDIIDQNFSWAHKFIGPAPRFSLIEETLENFGGTLLLWSSLSTLIAIVHGVGIRHPLVQGAVMDVPRQTALPAEGVTAS